jgi:hypothetical protein
MKWFWRVTGLALMCFIPIRFVYVFCCDVTHPELWEVDWPLHDVRFYGPMAIVVLAIGTCMVIHIYRVERRDLIRRNEARRLSR